jgi:flagellar basal-body rod protein FlgF
MVKGDDGLLRARGGGSLPPDADARLTPASLEGSNVNATAALVAMIDAQRAYEMNVKLVSTAQSIDEAGTRLMALPA